MFKVRSSIVSSEQKQTFEHSEILCQDLCTRASVAMLNGMHSVVSSRQIHFACKNPKIVLLKNRSNDSTKFADSNSLTQ